ncbi:MAG TPA: hypothetical protein VLI04_01975 [Nocardioidaceae bacterium]|nr:hypothetical protein [Nocardioidaceae bacterium]
MRETHRFNPWRRMRALGSTWKLKWSHDLPSDTYGSTDWGTRTITLAEGMSFEERRCTITHEVTHVQRGPASGCGRIAEEVLVDRISARLLLPSMRDVADTLVFHRGDHDRAAADLWVDPWMLEVRLSALYGLERAYLHQRIDDVVLLAADE